MSYELKHFMLSKIRAAKAQKRQELKNSASPKNANNRNQKIKKPRAQSFRVVKNKCNRAKEPIMQIIRVAKTKGREPKHSVTKNE